MGEACTLTSANDPPHAKAASNMNRKNLDVLRGTLSPVENDLVDHLLRGSVDRRGFLRHGSMLGLSLPLLGSIATGAGLMATPRAARAAGKPGGTIRVALIVPAGAIDPVTIADNGGLELLQSVGDYLCRTGPDFVLEPRLATNWTPDATGAVWTFKLREGVKFHNGTAMTAADVVATVDRLADPKNASNALSAFKGVLSKGGAQKVDDLTVAFHLDAPNGNFPYVLSSDNYNCIILPAAYAGDFEKNFVGTGPFKFESYTPKVGAAFVRNDAYWGGRPAPDRVEYTFYPDIQPMILALQGGQVDVIEQVVVSGGQAILNDPNVTIIRAKSSGHEQVHMRCDTGPFADKRVRQAMALALDREKLVKGLFKGYASVGNDSPFAPAFPSTDTAIAQRKQDLRKAKELLAAAGVPKGFKVTLTTEHYIEIPDYAVLVQNAARAIGIDITLNVESQDAYYGKATYGQSDWLDSTMGITDYGNRGVPNVTLSAPLLSDGTWNSAHFKNKEYDGLVGSYVKALDLGGQKAAAGKIQTLLLDETPLLFGYFYDFLVVTRKGVEGIPAIPNRLTLEKATLPA